MNSRKIRKPDRERINTEEEYEINEWAKKMGLTPAELRNALEKVGNRVTDVTAYIKTQRRK